MSRIVPRSRAVTLIRKRKAQGNTGEGETGEVGRRDEGEIVEEMRGREVRETLGGGGGDGR